MVAVQLGATEALVAWAATSVTSNDTPAAAWRKAQVTRLTASILVRGRASVFGVVVTQLVTQRRTRLDKGVGPALAEQVDYAGWRTSGHSRTASRNRRSFADRAVGHRTIRTVIRTGEPGRGDRTRVLVAGASIAGPALAQDAMGRSRHVRLGGWA